MTDFTGAKSEQVSNYKPKDYELCIQDWDPETKSPLDMVLRQKAYSYVVGQQSSGLLVVTFKSADNEMIATYTNVCYVKEL
jgi:hypothetical protein